ncbi:MAG: hypothetical protein HY331_10820 [Chloroflexi bacterium]|nr:hypothetical protein [Chloroflexota bacterium]
MNLHRPGPEEARLIGYGVSVWALLGYWHALDHDVDLVATDYDVPREAMEAALAYYGRHKALIDARHTSDAAAFAA